MGGKFARFEAEKSFPKKIKHATIATIKVFVGLLVEPVFSWQLIVSVVSSWLQLIV